MSFDTSGTSDPWHASENRGLARLRQLRAGAVPAPVVEAAACTSCGVVLFLEQDLLCPACYAARRGPGRLLPFDPGRRPRALARLAGRPCPDCLTVAWRVNVRGDATCQTCARGRADSTADGTNGVPPGGAA